jgi:hypothetical protein
MFSVIINIYNKKTKGLNLNGIFHSHRKTVFFLQLDMFDVCTTGDISSCKKNQFSYGCENSIKVGPLVFLL